jgi:two-component system response regulator PilR (NtrC family)
MAQFGGLDSFDEFPEEGIHFNDHIAAMEKRLLKAALECGGGVQTRAAKLLHMSLRSFRYLIQKYDLR